MIGSIRKNKRGAETLMTDQHIKRAAKAMGASRIFPFRDIQKECVDCPFRDKALCKYHNAVLRNYGKLIQPSEQEACDGWCK